jgi:hypothetical protein
MAYCALAKRITLFRRAAFSALCIIASLFATQLYFCVIGQCASWHSVLKSWSPVCLVLSTYFFLKNHQRIIPLLLIFSYIALKVLLWPTPAIYLVVDALQHTPSEDVILAPPELGNEIWFLTKHATVLNYDVIPSNSEGALEWRRRLLDLTNNADFSHGSREAIVRQGYDSLEISQIRDLAAKYNASLLLSRKVYDCPLVKQGGSLFIYDLKLCPSA